jgi:hypothetical protein
MIATVRAGWCAGLAVGFGLWAAAGAASAQQPYTTCGATEGGVCTGEAACGPLGMRMRPFGGRLCAPQYCAPTICPGSCFGYYRTQWTPWEQACPGWYTAPAVIAPPARPVPNGTAPPPPAPKAPETAPEPKSPAPAPAKEPGKEPPAAPKSPSSSSVPLPAPAGRAPGLVLPPVPDVPIGIPPEPPRSREFPAKS